MDFLQQQVGERVGAGAWTYADPTPANFYAQNISGAQRLPNGNVLVCNGPAGRFFEVTSTGTKVWDYINPVGSSGPVAQGTTPMQNIVFRAVFYATDYAAFAGRTLTAGAPIELNPLPATCTLVLATPDTPAALAAPPLAVFPKPRARGAMGYQLRRTRRGPAPRITRSDGAAGAAHQPGSG